MKASNILVIMTDELRRDTLGCYGNTYVKTPHIDKLAKEGIRFDNAYTPSPICVPARASIATGKYVHEHRCWANAIPYCGEIDSWHHTLRASGHRTTSIGKLHFRSDKDDNGFTEEIKPLHVKDGKGWIHGLLRERTDLFDASGFAKHIGPGEDPYTQYDRNVCELTLEWLKARSENPDPKGWAGFVSFLRPHYPLTCPSKFYDLYENSKLPSPISSVKPEESDHPVLKNLRNSCDYDKFFTKETRQIAVASYYGLCSFVDDMVGKIMRTLQETGLDKSTTVIFSSDHGECLGDRGFWTKMVMYEEASAVPLIIAGPDIKPKVEKAPVSLIDIYPTILDIAKAKTKYPTPKHAKSLISTALKPDMKRAILSEFHDYGAQTGMFMLRKENWKLILYPGFQSQLFNLAVDPNEIDDLAGDESYAEKISELKSEILKIADPKKINKNAFEDQEAMIQRLGGREAILAHENFDHTPVETS